jgi:hypothetical protein
MKTKSAAILILLILLSSCQNEGKQDDFYSSTKRWDLWRVPMLKPFEIVSPSRRRYWPKLSGDYRTTVIINAKTKEQFIFSGEHHQSEIRRKLKSLKAENIFLYSFDKVKTDFQTKGILPESWRG